MLATLFSAAILAVSASGAIDSAYTKIPYDADGGLTKCKAVDLGPDAGDSFVAKCPGYKKISVWFGEGDLRVFIGYGEKGRDEMAFGQTISYFNSVHDTIEWRLRDGKPFATILRWKVDGGEDLPKTEILVVTQLDAGNQCWIAVVDAKANANANEMARQAADTMAGKVTCEGHEPKVLGTPGPVYAP